MHKIYIVEVGQIENYIPYPKKSRQGGNMEL